MVLWSRNQHIKLYHIEEVMAMIELLVATKNQNKVKEFESILSGLFPDGLKMRTLQSLAQAPDVIEDRDTFEGNAIKKAVELGAYAGCSVMSEDSGLVVDVLGGAPGVYSARYAQVTPRSDAANNHKLIEALGAHEPPHTARYVAVVCLALDPEDELGRWALERLGVTQLEALPEGEPEREGACGRVGDRVVVWWRGECEGEMLDSPRGEGGFGYDPLFYVPELGKTLAEVPLAQKSAMSHRRRALEKMREAMR